MNNQSLPPIVLPAGFRGFIGTTRREVPQQVGDKTRMVSESCKTMTAVVQRTKPVQGSQKFEGSVFGFVAAAIGPNRIVNTVGYDEMADQMAALKRGDVVVFDGTVKYEGHKVFFYADSMSVQGNCLPKPAPRSRR